MPIPNERQAFSEDRPQLLGRCSTRKPYGASKKKKQEGGAARRVRILPTYCETGSGSVVGHG
jgi:hypothetical protein